MYYRRKAEEAFTELGSGASGLASQEAKARIQKFGYNALDEEKKLSPWKIFLSQFTSFIVWILFGATIVSVIVEEYIDGGVIFVIILINGILGFIQEFKAEKSLEALKKLASLKAKVLRDGKEVSVDAKELVPGDVIILREGDKVPADARVLFVERLESQEASLTGESTNVHKVTDAIDKDCEIADQHNMVFSGTVIVRGTGKAVVVATGMHTQIGKIAKLLEESQEELTPLQVKLKNLGKWLGIATIAITIIVFITGILRGKDFAEMLLTSISLAVAAIPEGLPAVVTISLALGVQRMIKRHSLIRKLPSVETLGSTMVICTDKTGTLTHNHMTVRKLFVNGKVVDVSGEGYSAKGQFSQNPRDFELLLRIGAVCNDATLNGEEVMGDPNEGALIISAAKAGLKHEALLASMPRIEAIPFDSGRKMMSTVNMAGRKRFMFVKGAPDIMADICDRIIIDGKIKRFDSRAKKQVLAENEEFAKNALRVLGFAYKELPGKAKITEKDENRLIFVGLQAMIDPPREEVKEAIARCKTAGIRVVMITGDHKTTAQAIAAELGIIGKSVEGKELDRIDLDSAVEQISIYARVNPEHKMRIVEAWKRRGFIVAVGGDGVNDAPALKKADIGVAMGITGTDVAKEASDMILTDDNFASIVNAVEEGRGIYDNIKKFVNFLLACNIGEVLIIFIAGFLFDSLPLAAIQLLWLNLITDGLPALALGVDPAARNIMLRKPRHKSEEILSRNVLVNIAGTSIIIAAVVLFLYWLNLDLGVDEARTVAFTATVVVEMAIVLMIRSVYDTKFFSNKFVWFAIASSIALQVLVVYYRPLNSIFKTVPLNFIEWVEIVFVSLIAFGFGLVVSRTIRKMTHEEF